MRHDAGGITMNGNQPKEDSMNTNQPKPSTHTPPPWKLIEEGIIAAQSATPVTAGGAPNPALLRTPVIAISPTDYPDYSQFKPSDWDQDAAHIVHCVNVHDQLVAALQRCIAALAANGAPNCEAVKEAKAALAAAESNENH